MLSDIPAIATSTLTKRYGTVTALAGIDLFVPKGLTYGFLGPNGAGKTTTIRLLMGFVRPTTGTAQISGYDCWREGVKARADLGFLVPAESLYPDMSGHAQLDYMAALSGKPPLFRQRLLDALELGSDTLGRRLNTYSKGMKQKLALTAALQTNPALLILDEPTDGLDPLIQRAFESVLAELRDNGATVFMSSHDLSEVERTCERVAIIREGKIVAEESIGELKGRHRRTAEVSFAGEPPPGIERLAGVSVIGREGACLSLAIDGSIVPLLRFLGNRDDVLDLLLPQPRLEDIFLGYYDMTANGHLTSDLPHPAASLVSR